MGEIRNAKSHDVLLLLAAFFDETAVVTCLTILRKAGLSVALVSNSTGFARGTHGITLRPDLTLGQIQETNIKQCQLLIIAGGREAAAKNLSDPRTHQLIEQILLSSGYVAIMARAYAVAVETGVIGNASPRQIIKQGQTETAVFVQQLIDQIKMN